MAERPTAAPPACEPVQLLEALEQQVLQLHVNNAHAKRRLAGQLQENLPPAAVPLLGVVLNRPGTPQVEIAESLMIDKASLSRLVTRMEEAGLLVRTPDPTDRRVSRLSPTPAARRRWDRAMTRQRGGWKSRMSQWPGEDLARLTTLLGRLNEELRLISALPDANPSSSDALAGAETGH